MSPLNVFAHKKRDGQKIAMISLYDAPTACIACDAGVDALLVGDSMGNVVLGHETTIPVTMEEMVGHTAAVVRGVRSSSRPGVPVIADMPFATYPSLEVAVANAARLMQVGAAGVKLEGDFPEIVRGLIGQGIPVMGHIGFTPQSHFVLNAVVQGRDASGAGRYLRQAQSLQSAGCFGVVLEAMTMDAAREITRQVAFATIGIGAGVDCDGQILVFQDLVGLSPRKLRFVKQYADTRAIWSEAAARFMEDVRAQSFPAPENSWAMSEGEAEKMFANQSALQPEATVGNGPIVTEQLQPKVLVKSC